MGQKKPDEKILGRLNDSEGYFVSGQSLAEQLGISRTAVWKRINSLRGRGFPIESHASRGYRLSGPLELFNETSIGAGLTTELIGQKIFFFDKISSTNERAVHLARNGEPEGAVVIADTQKEGRGRLGRQWVSPPGVNLYASIILRPGTAPHELQGITLLAAVAVAETVARFTPKRPVVKWPNDILVDSKKIAGILMEMHTEAEMADFVVAGIGVNLNMAARDFPPAVRPIATSIKGASGRPVPRAAFTQALLLSLEIWYKTFLEKGLSAIIKSWRMYFASEGKPVRVRSPRKTIEGICLGVDDAGALLVRLASGTTERVLAGDVEGPC